MIYILAARLLISSDSKAHAYAWRAKESVILPQVTKNKRLVFLQHGVIALKRVEFYRSGTNSVNLFITSNQREHDIIINELGYLPEEVVITGLAGTCSETNPPSRKRPTSWSCPPGGIGWRKSPMRLSWPATTIATIWRCSTPIGWRNSWNSTTCTWTSTSTRNFGSTSRTSPSPATEWHSSPSAPSP